MSEVKHFEHHTLKVPYEILNKVFRNAQKTIDREVAHVQGVTCDLENLLQKDKISVGEIKGVLDGLQAKLCLLKRKAEESVDSELEAAKVCKRRLNHLIDIEDPSLSVQALWRKKRLDRMLVEYFLREGYYNSAMQLARHSNIEDLTSLDVFLIAKGIEESLVQHDTSKCLSWCYENKSKLRRIKSTLEFKLRQQEFIELVRDCKCVEAVKHAKKHFGNAEKEQLGDVQHTMGLLALKSTQNTTILQYQELLDLRRWEQLVLQFRQENFKLYQLNSLPMFAIALQTGLSALKTPHCYTVVDKNQDCPVCTKHLNTLASSLPYAHCASSKLICQISGKAMDEHNPPMMLPNGNVYGFNALAAMAIENDGQIICPRSKQVYSFKDMEKVFVM